MKNWMRIMFMAFCGIGIFSTFRFLVDRINAKLHYIDSKPLLHEGAVNFAGVVLLLLAVFFVALGLWKSLLAFNSYKKEVYQRPKRGRKDRAFQPDPV